MKKILFTFLILIYSHSSFSQVFSYGIVTGVEMFRPPSTNDKILRVGWDNYHLNYGVYGEYGISKRFGVKFELIYNSKSIQIWSSNNLYAKINYIDFNSNLKLNLGSKYNKGFYLVTGGRVSSMIKNDNNLTNIDDIDNYKYNKIDYGLQFGAGFRFVKCIDFQLRYDNSISEFLSYKNEKAKYFSLNALIYIDLEKILNR